MYLSSFLESSYGESLFGFDDIFSSWYIYYSHQKSGDGKIMLLPVNTAIVVSVGPLIDDSDFKSLKTDIVYNSEGMSIDLIKGSDSAITKEDIVPTDAGDNDWTHKGNSIYELEITSTQNNVLGTLKIIGIVDGCLPFESSTYTIVPLKVYNSLITGIDNLQVNSIKISDSSDAADALELISLNARGTDNKILISDNTQDLSISLFVDAKKLNTETPYNFDPSTDTVVNVTNVTSSVDINSNADISSIVSQTDKMIFDTSMILSKAIEVEDKINYTILISDKTGFSISENLDKNDYTILSTDKTGFSVSEVLDKIDYTILSTDKTGFSVDTVLDKTNYTILISDKTGFSISENLDKSDYLILLTDKTGFSINENLDKTDYTILSADKTGFSISENLDKTDYKILVSDKTGFTVSTVQDKINYTILSTDKTGFSLISTYDSAKSAASQTSVNTIDTVVDNIKLQTDKMMYDASNNIYANVSDQSDVATSVWAYGTRALTDRTGYSLTTAYDRAKTAALPGEKMDIINIPNSTAVTAIQAGLARTGGDGDTLETISDQIDDIESGSVPLVAQIVEGVLEALVDGHVDLQTALSRILACTTNSVEVTGLDPKILYYKDSSGDNTVVTKTIPLSGDRVTTTF